MYPHWFTYAELTIKKQYGYLFPRGTEHTVRPAPVGMGAVNPKESHMGHYAAEMESSRSQEGEHLRKRYRNARNQLEHANAGVFTVGQLKEVLELLDYQPNRGARDAFEHNRTFVEEKILRMETLLQGAVKQKS